jgi:hypothetical protein
MWQGRLAPSRVKEPYAVFFVTEIVRRCLDDQAVKIGEQRSLATTFLENVVNFPHAVDTVSYCRVCRCGLLWEKATRENN